jgi:hypothetical protein
MAQLAKINKDFTPAPDKHASDLQSFAGLNFLDFQAEGSGTTIGAKPC